MADVLTTGNPAEAPSTAAPMGAPVENAAPAAESQSAPSADQGLTFKTQAEFEQAVDARLNAMKQDWLNEAYRNTQSMNDKFQAAVNQKMKQLEQLGIKADQVQTAKLVRAEQQAQQQQRVEAAQQNRIDPGYQKFLDRFGATRNARDQRLMDAYSLETEYEVQLDRADPEYQKYFADPRKDFGSGYMFQRAYEKALSEKKARMAEQTSNENAPANPAAVPSLSGNNARSNTISNTESGMNLIAMGAEEMRRRMKF